MVKAQTSLSSPETPSDYPAALLVAPGSVPETRTRIRRRQSFPPCVTPLCSKDKTARYWGCGSNLSRDEKYGAFGGVSRSFAPCSASRMQRHSLIFSTMTVQCEDRSRNEKSSGPPSSLNKRQSVDLQRRITTSPPTPTFPFSFSQGFSAPSYPYHTVPTDEVSLAKEKARIQAELDRLGIDIAKNQQSLMEGKDETCPACLYTGVATCIGLAGYFAHIAFEEGGEQASQKARTIADRTGQAPLKASWSWMAQARSTETIRRQRPAFLAISAAWLVAGAYRWHLG